MLRTITFLTLTLFAALSHAAEIQADNISLINLSGFGTLGAVVSTIDKRGPALVQVVQDNSGIQRGEPPFITDSKLGLQMDVLFNPNFSATAQILLKDRPDQNLDNSLQWAFLKFKPVPALQIRAGRIGLDMFLLSDQRNVGFTYLWVRPPIEFYGPEFFYSVDGADARYSTPLADGVLDTKVFFGSFSPTIQANKNTRFNLLIDHISGANLVFSNDAWRIRIGYARAIIGSGFAGLGQLQSSLNTALASGYADAARLNNGLMTQGTQAQFISTGFSYEHDSWQVQGEVANLNMENHLFGNDYSGYLILSKQIDKWTPYISIASVIPSKEVIKAAPAPSPAFQPLVDATNSVFTGARDNQETLSLGARWDFRDNMDLKLQYDQTHVRDGGYGLWLSNGQIPKPDDTFHLLSLTLDFIF